MSRIRRNASVSPLLGLPAEIRERILAHLLGDRVIHVTHPHPLANEYSCGYPGHRFSHNVCQKDPIREPVATATMVTCVGGREHHCQCKGGDPEKWDGCTTDDEARSSNPTLKDSLNVMGACRQLYREAHHILWTSNTWSFDCPRMLSMFVTSLNQTQRSKIENLHIFGTHGRLTDAAGAACGWLGLNSVGSVLNSKTLSLLRNVTHLDICIDQGWTYAHPGWRPVYKDTDGWNSSFESLTVLRVLPLKAVLVSFTQNAARSQQHSDNAPIITGYPPHPFCVLDSLSSEQKNKYASQLTQTLLTADGLSLQKSAERERKDQAKKQNEEFKDWREIDTLRRSSGYASSYRNQLDIYKTCLEQERAEVTRIKRKISMAEEEKKRWDQERGMGYRLHVAENKLERTIRTIKIIEQKKIYWDEVHERNTRVRDTRLARRQAEEKIQAGEDGNIATGPDQDENSLT